MKEVWSYWITIKKILQVPFYAFGFRLFIGNSTWTGKKNTCWLSSWQKQAWQVCGYKWRVFNSHRSPECRGNSSLLIVNWWIGPRFLDSQIVRQNRGLGIQGAAPTCSEHECSHVVLMASLQYGLTAGAELPFLEWCVWSISQLAGNKVLLPALGEEQAAGSRPQPKAPQSINRAVCL